MSTGVRQWRITTVSALAVNLIAPAVWAQDADHAGHGQTPAAAAAQSQQSGNGGAALPMTDASKAFEEAMGKMHRDMSIPYSNDVDVDFVRGMIPHHQGAIDQAKVLLKFSTNPRLRRLAGGIIAAQRREILFMQKWLEAREKNTELEMPEWLKNTQLPDDVRNPTIDK